MLTTRTHKKQLLLFCFTLLLFIFSFAQNPIVTENALPGNPYSDWGLPDVQDVFRDDRIAGFATQMSVNSGETVRFKIKVQSGSGSNYTIKIFRIGYYGGNGARLIDNLGFFNHVPQPDPLTDAVTGLVDCGNWDESATWDVPASAVSGLYIAKLERMGGGSNHILFVVRNDVPDLAFGSDLLLQIPDATWQAYNGYGGNNMYDGTTEYPAGHAVKVSYNRPFFIYNAGFNGEDKISNWYMNNEYSMIRWLERNGYNVTYTTNVDAASRPEQLLYHKVFISLGHDEYWSKEQRDNVEAARNAGVHLAFFSGNEVYWKTRWENSIDGTNTPYRTLVCYKEGKLENEQAGERVCGYGCDPSPLWTGLWRIGSSGYGGVPGDDNYFGNAENKLTGQSSWDEVPGSLQVPAAYKKLRFWRNTTIPNLATGQTATLAPNTVAYEWDWEKPFDESYPRGRITMSSTTLNSKTHKISLYRHSSGALVFGAGTVQWSWGLDGDHFDGTSEVSQDMQQATVNLFADMGTQPGSLQADLIPATQSTDFIAPACPVLSLSYSAPITTGTTVTFAGNATDNGGGVVAGVEVSTNGGATWNIASNSDPDVTTAWNYPMNISSTANPIRILSRGFDDSGNMGAEETAPKVTITVTLQGRPTVLPNSVWQVPLQIDFYLPNTTTLVASYNLTTNNAGAVTITDLPEGTYDVAVKGSHTLKRVKRYQTLADGYNLVIFGSLLEGDIYTAGAQYNIVNIYDLGILLSSYAKAAGDPGFVPNADLNGDGFVNIFDLGLLLSNYTIAGETP